MPFYGVSVKNENQIHANPERSVANDRKWVKTGKRHKKRGWLIFRLPPPVLQISIPGDLFGMI